MENKYPSRNAAHDFLITCHVARLSCLCIFFMRKTLQKAKYLHILDVMRKVAYIDIIYT